MSRKKRKARKVVAKSKRTYRGITYRSGLECTIAKRLARLDLQANFEPFKVDYVLYKKYVPDFVINDIWLEAKGVLMKEDREKMLAVREQYQDQDIRFVFEKPHSKCAGLKSTHAEWAEKNGFKWHSVEDLGKRTLK